MEIRHHQLIDIPTSKLVFDQDNPNKMSQGQQEALDHGMERYGFLVPIVVDQNFKIADGEWRARRYIARGLKAIPGYQVSLDSDIERRLLRQLLNNLRGRQDPLKYANELKAIFEGGKLEELAQLMAESKEVFERELEKRGLMDFAKPGADDFDIDRALEGPAVVKRGQVWKLGKHRLMCGDSTSPQDIAKLLADLLVDQLNTDPPFGVDYGGKTVFLQEHNKSNRKARASIANDNIDNYRDFFASFLKPIPFASYNTAYIFMSGQELHTLRLAVEDAGMTWSDYLIWVKNHFVLGRKDYNARHEFILYGWKGRHKFYGPHDSTVLEYDRPQKSELHPTMKPVALLCRLISDGTEPGMVVYDAFGGSGSSLIACEDTGRVCCAMEYEERYCDVIIKRWEEHTGQKAERIYPAK